MKEEPPPPLENPSKLGSSMLSYSQWLISSHRMLLVRWAQIFIFVMCASMLHPVGRLPVYQLYCVGFITFAVNIIRSAYAAGASKKVQFWFGCFASLQAMVVFQMACVGKAPAVHSYFDWATNLSTLVPQMLVLDLRSGKLALFLATHTVAEAAFYLSVVGHSLPSALLRATWLFAMVLGVYLSFRRQAYAEYRLRMGQSPEHVGSPLPQQKGRKEAPATGTLPLPADQQHIDEAPQAHSVTGGSDGGAGVYHHKGSTVGQVLEQKHSQGTQLKQGLQAKLPDKDITLAALVQEQSQGTRLQQTGKVEAMGPPPQTAAHVPGKHKLRESSSLQLRSARSTPSIRGPADPALYKALVRTSRARAERPRQQYCSKVEQSGMPQPNATHSCVQQAYRLAVKMDSPWGPEQVPGGAVQQLRCRLQRYQHLSHGEKPAVRAGCVVVSFGTSPLEGYNQGLSVQEMRQHTAAVAKEWAQQHGLLADDDMLIVQACHQSSWVIAQQGQPSPSGFSMSVHTPFLIASPSSQDKQAPVQQQTQAELDASALPQEQEACSCQFKVTLAAPPHLELRGWQGAADAPEELPDEIKSRSLCLLASVDGQFLPTSVEQHSMSSDGERVAQARVSLLGANTSCPKEVVLEAWADGFMVCSYSAVLLPSSYSGALAELQGMRQGDEEGSRVFVRDLVLWAHFLASSRSAQQQQQQQQQGEMAAAAEEAHQEQLALMSGVGKDLLEHSFSEGMVEVAGLLLEGLTDLPFCMPANALLQDQLLGSDHLDSVTESSVELQETSDDSDAAAVIDVPPASELSSTGRHASLWTAAASACIKGFGEAPNSASQPTCTQQQHQQQQQHCLTEQPTEAGYREWGTHFSKQFLHIRFNCCCFGSLFALIRETLQGNPVKALLMLVNLTPYIVNFYKPRAGLQTAKYVHMALWSLMGLGLTYMEANTRNMIHLNVDAVVLVLFFSPSLDQAGLQALIFERMLTTVVFALLSNCLQTWRPLLRSLIVNCVAFSIDCALDVYFRYLFLKYLTGQKQYVRKNL